MDEGKWKKTVYVPGYSDMITKYIFRVDLVRDRTRVIPTGSNFALATMAFNSLQSTYKN